MSMGFILFLILYVFLIFSAVACLDSPSISKNLHFDLVMPSVRDLDLEHLHHENEVETKRYIDKYVVNVILPAHDYFKLKNDINKSIDSYSSNSIFVILFAITAFCSRLTLFFKSIELNIPDFFFILLVIFISVVFTAVIGIISDKIYERTYKMRDFETSLEWFEKNRSLSENIFNLDDKAKINNDIIEIHNEYLQGIKQGIKDREKGAKILIVVNFLLLLLVIVKGT